MKIAKRLLALVLTVATLLSCTGCAAIKDGFSQILGMWEELMAGSTTLPTDPDPTEPGDPCEGHYLIDLFDPVDTAHPESDPFKRLDHMMHEDEEIVMAGETFKKGIRFKQGKTGRLYLEYDIGGKYKEISFFYGMDESVLWYAHNVAFQIVNAETDEIIWEDLFERGDIPRFATVNIEGVNLIRLVCFNPDGGSYCFGNVTVWEGESQATDRSYPIITEPTMLEDNYKFYYSAETYTMAPSYTVRNFGESQYANYIKGEIMPHSALINFGGEDGDDLYMNLRGQFKQISFYFGIADKQDTVSENFKGWVSIYADGKCVLDEYICTTETPAQTITLDVDYAWQLRVVTRSTGSYSARFCLAKLRGGEYLGEATENERRFHEPVSMLRTYPPHFIEDVFTYSKVYNSSSRYLYFSMGGNKYCEGIVLRPKWDVIFDTSGKADPAYVIADLEGEQKYLSFTMGHVDAYPYKDAVVEIYLDDEEEPSYTFPIDSTELPKDYVIDVRNCRTIKFLCTCPPESNSPAIGIANIVAYPDEVVENDIFQPYYKEYPESCELLDYFTPFGYYSAYIEHPVYTDEVLDIGMYYKTCDGEERRKGILFCSSYDLINWDCIGFMDLLAAIAAGCIVMGETSADRHSYYFFNLNDQYDTLTFKTAKVTEISTQGLPTYINLNDPDCAAWLQEIKIYGDNSAEPLYSCNLVDGQVQEHTIDVSGVNRLIICIPSNSHLVSEVYSAFDLFLSQNED